MPTPISRTALLAELEAERASLSALLPRFSDAQWYSAARSDGWTAHDIATHLADSNYGLALMVLGELQPAMPIDAQTGWIDPSEVNQQRRQKNASLPREKVASRMASSFEHARRAIEAVSDYDAAGPYGPVHTKGQWLTRIVAHAREHRQDLEHILAEIEGA